MDFTLKRDLVFLDLETTGLNVIKDRIIQIALIKYTKDSDEPVELEMLINPGIPISPESIQITGITPEMLKNKPTFGQVADQIYKFIGDADLSGYNSDRFDIPIIIEEFNRAGYDFDISKRNLIDVQKIFYKMEPRTLKAAYKFYCNAELENAHNALADVRATAKILKGQIEKYRNTDLEDENGNTIEKPISNDLDKLAKFLADHSTLDVTQRLRYDINGEVVFNFGKYIGQHVGKTLYEDRQYYQWIQEKEFSVQVKKLTTQLLKEYQEKLKSNGSK